MVDFAEVDSLAAGYHQRGGQPGLAYGIVIGGELAHAGGLGVRHVGGPPPDAGTVFRIASMTKSFTATAILALRDEGTLRLDDLAEEYVPELADWQPVSPDSARISIRHLLTMTAGFPTDDPWGDRQQGLPLEEFSHFLAKGVSLNWAPGTQFEYSNMGYAILGRVIAAVSGQPYPDYVHRVLLSPLGMTRTGFEAEEFTVPGQLATGPGGLAQGLRAGAGDGSWSEVAFDVLGAFAPMGGVFGLGARPGPVGGGLRGRVPARVTGRPGAPAGARHPARDAAPAGPQPDGSAGAPSPGTPRPRRRPTASACSCRRHLALGRIVSHSGGYPGFGSNMRWHPATGTGVIVLGNSTYAAGRRWPPGCSRRWCGRGDPRLRPGVAPAGAGPWPETLAARDAVGQLLQAWDDDGAPAVLA